MLENLKPPVRVQPCRVREIFESLDSSDQTIFSKAILDRDAWTAHGLSVELRKIGLQIGDDTIRKHRAGECSC